MLRKLGLRGLHGCVIGHQTSEWVLCAVDLTACVAAEADGAAPGALGYFAACVLAQNGLLLRTLQGWLWLVCGVF